MAGKGNNHAGSKRPMLAPESRMQVAGKYLPSSAATGAGIRTPARKAPSEINRPGKRKRATEKGHNSDHKKPREDEDSSGHDPSGRDVPPALKTTPKTKKAK